MCQAQQSTSKGLKWWGAACDPCAEHFVHRGCLLLLLLLASLLERQGSPLLKQHRLPLADSQGVCRTPATSATAACSSPDPGREMPPACLSSCAPALTPAMPADEAAVCNQFEAAADINKGDPQSPRAGASSNPRRKSLGKRDSGEMDSPWPGSLGKRSSGELLQPGDGPGQMPALSPEGCAWSPGLAWGSRLPGRCREGEDAEAAHRETPACVSWCALGWLPEAVPCGPHSWPQCVLD